MIYNLFNYKSVVHNSYSMVARDMTEIYAQLKARIYIINHSAVALRTYSQRNMAKLFPFARISASILFLPIILLLPWHI